LPAVCKIPLSYLGLKYTIKWKRDILEDFFLEKSSISLITWKT
jgi:hypothetical protein